jgi:hypothetical protein
MIAGGMITVLAPTGREVVHISDDVNETEVVELRMRAPPKRLKEKHGSSKRKRKEGTKSSNPKGRTKTATFACTGTTKEARKDARQMCATCRRAGRSLDANDWHKAKTCPYDITDVDAVEFNVPPTKPSLRVQPKTSYTSGKPVKEKVVPILKSKGKDVAPKKQRLRAKPKTSDTSGKPVKEKKMRILSLKGDEDMKFVLE